MQTTQKYNKPVSFFENQLVVVLLTHTCKSFTPLVKDVAVSITLAAAGGMRKINTIGLAQANKCMHLSAIAYNLKKHLKFTKDTVQSQEGVLLCVFYH